MDASVTMSTNEPYLYVYHWGDSDDILSITVTTAMLDVYYDAAV